MTRAKAGLLLLLLVLGFALPAAARTIRIEFLQGAIDQKNVGLLYGLACRNYDHIVHLDIAVDWPQGSLDVEDKDFERLVFWNEKAEYLFPKGTYVYLHGSYVVKGYFIARSGGMHQGQVSNAFDKIDDAQVLLNPYVQETRARGARCKK